MQALIRHFAVPWHGVTLSKSLVILAVVAASALLGSGASLPTLASIALVLAFALVLRVPSLGLNAIVVVALFSRFQLNTGTDVSINAVSLLIPVLFAIWLARLFRRQDRPASFSPIMVPLLLFLLANLASLVIGRVMWDPTIPVRSSFLLVQIAQWSIFLFSAIAFWLAAYQVKDEAGLYYLTWSFLFLAGSLAVVISILGLGAVVGRIASLAVLRATFWVLVTGIAGGQLLFAEKNSLAMKLMLTLVLIAVARHAFFVRQEAGSNWVGVSSVVGTLVWLRWPRLRWPIVLILVTLLLFGAIVSFLFEFGGGTQEWELSGGSRLSLIERVLSVALRNPVTGLGPAAYRLYAGALPLQYGRAFWANPNVNSHNNYVDIFAHSGLIGLSLFLWFLAEVARLGLRLHRRFRQGFIAGYVNGMIATFAGIVVIMLLLDWFLPFIYNVGFEGFQASVLVWLFLGGLVAIDRWDIHSGRELGKAC